MRKLLLTFTIFSLVFMMFSCNKAGKISIIFEENGGSEVKDIELSSDTTKVELPNTTRDGYQFEGWFADADLKKPYVFTTIPSDDITLYAKWSEVVQNQIISFETNGGSAISAITQVAGSTVTAPANPSKEGSTFGGWFTDVALNTPYVFTTMPANSLTLYAKWMLNSYTMSFEANGGSVVPNITQAVGSAVVAPANPSKEGSTFGGWFANSALTTAYVFTTMPANNITLYAKWTVAASTISFEGAVVTSITQAPGSAVVAPANPSKEGSTFGGWFTDVALTKPFVFNTMPANSLTLYAKWTVNSYTISFAVNGGSTVANMTKAFGSAVTAPANFSKEGSTFGGWFTDAALKTPYVFTTMPAKNITLYAKWTVNTYTVKFEVNGGSTVPNITKAFGADVAAPSKPSKEGSTFDGWFTDIALKTRYGFTTMPANDLTLYAKWTVNDYVLSYVENGGTTLSNFTHRFGDVIAAPANFSKVGSSFGGWFADQDFNVPYVFATMPNKDLMLYAKWIVNTYTISFAVNGGTSVRAITQEFGTNVTEPTGISREEAVFAGWFADAALTTSYVFTTMPANNITLYAKWVINCYTISFEEDGGSIVADITQEFDSVVASPADPTKDAALFEGWFADAALTIPYVFATMPANDITLYAKWGLFSNTVDQDLGFWWP
ncbi:MAG TPA: InlB B-repeat-containing protein [Bacilli bacterium]|nr:InlB B-repeat-containing protein [Bacilli bacterium]